MEAQRITGPGRAREVATELNSARRGRPAVVVSVAAATARLWIEADRIADELTGLADVYVLANSAVSWAFADAMPPGTQVYGGAGRFYPPGLDWVRDPTRAPLRLAYSAAGGEAATERLIEDGVAAAAAAGLLGGSRGSSSRETTGKVTGCPTSSQAMVRCSDGTYVMITTGLIAPGVPAERLFRPRMPVSGRMDPDTRRLDVRAMVPDPAARAGELQEGQALLARIERVWADHCEVALLPGLLLPVSGFAVTGEDDGDDVRDLVSVGEVVAVRVVTAHVVTVPDVTDPDVTDPDVTARDVTARFVTARDVTARDVSARDAARVGASGRELVLQLLDAEEDETLVEALAVLPGGPPWLVAPQPLTPVEDEQPTEQPGTTETPDPLPTDVPQQRRPTPPPTPPPAEPARPRPTPALLAVRAREAPEAPEPGAPSPGVALRTTQQNLAVTRNRVAHLEGLVANRDAEVRSLAAEVTQLKQELDQGARRLERTDRDLRRLRKTHRKDVQHRPPAFDDLFLDGEEQFRFEVDQRWATRIPAAEKATRRPLPYTFGPRFLSSLDEIQGVDRRKVIDVVVEVVTHLAESVPGREMHQLRTGTGPEDGPLRRGGASCWRVSLQRSTPQARRLHFWRHAEGIELSRVVLHDDFEA